MSKISDQINKLKNIARFGETQWKESSTAAVRIFGTGEETVSFLSVGVLKEFRDITSTLYYSNQTIQYNYTHENFIVELVDLLRSLNKENREAENDDWINLINNLITRPNVETEIAVPLFGVLLQNPFIAFGDFTVYSSFALKEKYPSIINTKGDIANSEYFLVQRLSAKSVDKCREVAEKIFFMFENVANFITAGFHKTYKISLFDKWFSSHVEHLVFVNNKILQGVKTFHKFKPVRMEISYFNDELNGYGNVWRLITLKRNDLQDKILESIEWSGKASVETDDNKALLLYAIAIEAILNYTHNSSLYVPTTISLADSVAFLLGKNKKSRIQYASYVTELYRIRSGIVHGSVKQVSELDLHTAFSLSHQVIKKILTEEPYKNFTSKKQLSEYLLKEKKYEMGETNL